MIIFKYFPFSFLVTKKNKKTLVLAHDFATTMREFLSLIVGGHLTVREGKVLYANNAGIFGNPEDEYRIVVPERVTEDQGAARLVLQSFIHPDAVASSRLLEGGSLAQTRLDWATGARERPPEMIGTAGLDVRFKTHISEVEISLTDAGREGHGVVIHIKPEMIDQLVRQWQEFQKRFPRQEAEERFFAEFGIPFKYRIK